MNDQKVFSALGMHMVNDCLVVQVNGDLDDAYIQKLRQDLLINVKMSYVREVLIDVSAIRVLDAFTFSIFRDIAQMISLLGAGVVFVGFQAGVASALVDLGVELGDIRTAVTMEDGFELLRAKTSDVVTTEPIEELSVIRPNNELGENE
jgi:rsbT antagonist protein RsbS